MADDKGVWVAQPLVTKLGEAEATEIAGGVKTRMQMLISPEQAPNFAMRCFTIEPGGSMPAHTNSIEHEQYVLGGRAEVGIGDMVYDLGEGDVLFIPAGVPHWYRTTSEDEPYRFLCLVPNAPDRIDLLEG